MSAWMQDKSTDGEFMLWLILAVALIFVLSVVAEYFYKLWKETR